MTYYVGQRATLSTQVTDTAGALTDATVALVVTRPDGTTVTPTVNHPSTGAYNADVTLDQAGDWLYVWSATGAVVTTETGQIHAVAAGLRIVGLSEVKEHGNITGAASDRELLDFIGTSQHMIENLVGSVVPTTVTDELHTAPCGAIWLRHIPVLSVTAVTEYAGTTAFTSLATADWELDAEIGALTRVYGRWLGDRVRVTYRSGRSPIPESLRWAAKELTIHLWRSTQSGRGGRGRSTTGEDVALVGAGYGLPNRVSDALQPFLRPPAVA